MAKTFSRLLLVLLVLACTTPAWAKKNKNDKSSGKVKKSEIKVERSGMKSDAELKKCVKEYRSECYIQGIAMVDQRRDPTCAVATLKRLLKYYGDTKVSMEAIKRLVNYDKNRGTSTRYMVESIRRYSGQIRLSYTPVYDFAVTTDELRTALEAYNKKANSKDKIEIPSKAELRDEGFIDLIRGIDFSTWRSVRQDGTKKERQKAWRDIKDSVNRGVPLIWCVWLGMVKEGGNKQLPGGHMRMIIGYNDKDNEIIYTDSWGKGHAKKSMKWRNAWAITNSIFILSPRN